MGRPIKPLSGRPPRDTLGKFVQQLPPASSVLGLTHVTSGYVLREIIDNGQIFPPGKCTVLNEALVYLFYGRPSYRLGLHDGPTNLAFLCPVVLIVDPAIPIKPKYAFGFDSGAFVAGMMDSLLDPYMPLLDFQIPTDTSSAARLAQAMFGSPDRYLSCQQTLSLSIDQGNFEAVSYCEIARNGVALNLDDRSSTPEFAYDSPIDITPWVKAAIVPDVLSSDDTCGGQLRRLGVHVIDYEWQGGCRPNEYHVLIKRLVRQAHEKFSWL